MRTISVLMLLAGIIATGSVVNGQTIISGKKEISSVSYISEDTTQTDAYAGIHANIAASIRDSRNNPDRNTVR